MRQPDFGQPPTPPVTQHLHDDADAVDGDVVEGLHHGLPVELELQPELADPLGFRWRVPLSLVHNPSSVLAL